MPNAASGPTTRGVAMLEKLPDMVGHALRGQRAGLDKTAFQAVDLRGGMAAITVGQPGVRRPRADPRALHRRRRGRVAAAAAGPACRRRRHRSLLIVEDADAPTPQPLVHAIVVELPAGDGAACRRRPCRAATTTAPAFGSAATRYLQASWLPPDPPPGPRRASLRLPGVRPRGAARASTASRGARRCSRRSASTAWRAAA